MDQQKMFECSDNDLMMKGTDKEELKKYGRMHIQEKHGMEPSEEDLENHFTEAKSM